MAVFEQYVEYEEGAEPFFFDQEDRPVYLLARSDDMVAWTTTELPVVDAVSDSEYGTSVFMAGATATDETFVAVFNQFHHQPSAPMALK